MTIEPFAWDSGRLQLLDQTRLPVEEAWLELTNHHEVAEAGVPGAGHLQSWKYC